jgi:hypothetical protein
MLRGKMVVVLVVDHVWRGKMAERRVLMETCRHHGCDWLKPWVCDGLHHKAFPLVQSLKTQRRRQSHTRCNGLSRIGWKGGERRQTLTAGFKRSMVLSAVLGKRW